MDRPTRNAIERATQRARRLLEAEFAAQLEGTYDILRDGSIGSSEGARAAAFGRAEATRVHAPQIAGWFVADDPSGEQLAAIAAEHLHQTVGESDHAAAIRGTAAPARRARARHATRVWMRAMCGTEMGQQVEREAGA